MISDGNPQSRLQQCPYCAQAAGVIWVHGHGQCAACKVNIDECCRGEQVTPHCPARTT
jgi:hypothetical protein